MKCLCGIGKKSVNKGYINFFSRPRWPRTECGGPGVDSRNDQFGEISFSKLFRVKCSR